MLRTFATEDTVDIPKSACFENAIPSPEKKSPIVNSINLFINSFLPIYFTATIITQICYKLKLKFEL